jgi:HSP20 family molecular chaperone IbpA
MTSLVPGGFTPFPEIIRWLESFNVMAGHAPMHIEDYLDNGNYVLRAELPGMDPAKDITVTVQDNVLSVTAERTETKRENSRSEFHYGSFARSVSLPRGADPRHIEASYDAGVLQVTVPVRHEAPQSRQIPVTAAKHE